jgi:hypothetical protein
MEGSLTRKREWERGLAEALRNLPPIDPVRVEIWKRLNAR